MLKLEHNHKLILFFSMLLILIVPNLGAFIPKEEVKQPKFEYCIDLNSDFEVRVMIDPQDNKMKYFATTFILRTFKFEEFFTILTPDCKSVNYDLCGSCALLINNKTAFIFHLNDYFAQSTKNFFEDIKNKTSLFMNFTSYFCMGKSMLPLSLTLQIDYPFKPFCISEQTS